MRKEPETIPRRGEWRVRQSKRVAERANVVGALLLRQPGAQPPYRLGVMPLVGRIDGDHQGRQIADIARRRRKPELAREHADDGVRLAPEPDRPADNGGIGCKASTPKILCEHHDGLPVLELARVEKPAESRHESDGAEKVAGDAQTANRLRSRFITDERFFGAI